MKNIKVAICGISCSGKSSLCDNLSKYNISFIQGSSTLCKLGNIDKNTLKTMDIESKNILRLQFLEYLQKIESKEIIIVDSHFCFPLDSINSTLDSKNLDSKESNSLRGGRAGIDKVDSIESSLVKGIDSKDFKSQDSIKDSKSIESKKYDIAMSEKDFLLYDVILFLYVDSNIIKNRMLKRDNKDISLKLIESWQEYELENLELNAKKYNKIFSVINENVEYMASFLHTLNNNFKKLWALKDSSILESKDFTTQDSKRDFKNLESNSQDSIKKDSKNIESKIQILPQLVFNDFYNANKAKILESKNIILSDCDGTLSTQDALKEFYKIKEVSTYKIPNAFCNHRFFGFYQFFCLTKLRLEITESTFNNACEIAAKNMILNENLTQILESSNALVIVLTAGLRSVWKLKFIESKLDFLIVANDRFSIISKETKGYFALAFKKMGFNVVAFGDGSVDIEMLANANKAVVLESTLNIKNAIFINHTNSLQELQEKLKSEKLKGIVC